MKPKKYKEFKKDIADQVEVHGSVVDDFISFYYARIRESLSNLDDSRIYVDGLGTFSIRKARLEKAIVKNKSFLGNLDKQTYRGYSKSINTQKKIVKFEKMLEKIEQSFRKRKEFKSKVNERDKKNI
tara:strand:- start:624 stop:1004 length:381 start_codon:yes stop_codon:yes gene_type:complete